MVNSLFEQRSEKVEQEQIKALVVQQPEVVVVVEEVEEDEQEPQEKDGRGGGRGEKEIHVDITSCYYRVIDNLTARDFVALDHVKRKDLAMRLRPGAERRIEVAYEYA